MTTNLFVIVNVKQMWTGGSFRILLPFFRTSWGVGVLNSAIVKLIGMVEWNTKHFPLNLQSGLTLSNFRDVGGGFELRNEIRHCKTVCIKRNLYLINYTIWEHSELQKQIETPVLLAHAIEDSTDIFGISGGVEHPKPPPPRYTNAIRYTCPHELNNYSVLLWRLVHPFKQFPGSTTGARQHKAEPQKLSTGKSASYQWK